MSKPKQIVLLISLVFLFGCFNRVVNVGKVSPITYLDNIKSSPNSLHILIASDIPDTVEVNTAGLKQMIITQYRESLKEGFVNTFSKYFSKIIFVNTPTDGLLLTLRRAAPKTVKTVPIQIATQGLYATHNYTNYEVKIRVKYNAELSKDGKRISVISNLVTSEESMSNIYGTEIVLADSMRLMLEDIGNNLFKAETIEN